MINRIELLNKLYKRAKEGYYNDKPAYQFSKDELNLKYCLWLIDEPSYQLEKQKLDQRINEYYFEQRAKEYYQFKQRYLLLI